jgi:hypothetical protein
MVHKREEVKSGQVKLSTQQSHLPETGNIKNFFKNLIQREKTFVTLLKICKHLS